MTMILYWEVTNLSILFGRCLSWLNKTSNSILLVPHQFIHETPYFKFHCISLCSNTKLHGILCDSKKELIDTSFVSRTDLILAIYPPYTLGYMLKTFSETSRCFKWFQYTMPWAVICSHSILNYPIFHFGFNNVRSWQWRISLIFHSEVAQSTPVRNFKNICLQMPTLWPLRDCYRKTWSIEVSWIISVRLFTYDRNNCQCKLDIPKHGEGRTSYYVE